MDVCNDTDKRQQVFEEIMSHRPPPLKIEHARIPVGKVHFDPENPRLKYQKERFPNKSEKELLFEHPDTPWLKRDIEEKGLLDPIYVRARTADATYIVVEGNRRTAVMQELNSDHPDNPLFCFIPARILPENTSQEQEALLMASYHVSGKIKWDAHEKAGHIWHMVNKLRIPESELSNTLHMGVPAIKRAAESYALLEHYKKVDGGRFAGDVAGKWSFFNEMLKVKEFAERHRKSEDWADQFCRWVGEGRIPKAENVRDLEPILKKVKARNLFENEPPETAFEKARREVDATQPSRNSKFFKKLEETITAGKQASLTDIDSAANNEASRDLVIEAYQVLLAFMERAGVRVPGTARRVAA